MDVFLAGAIFVVAYVLIASELDLIGRSLLC